MKRRRHGLSRRMRGLTVAYGGGEGYGRTLLWGIPPERASFRLQVFREHLTRERPIRFARPPNAT